MKNIIFSGYARLLLFLFDRYVSNIPGVYMFAMPVVAALLPAYNEEHHVASVLVWLWRYLGFIYRSPETLWG